MLTKDQILQANDTRTIDVEVPEWNGTVRVKVMSSLERQQFQAVVNKKKDETLFMERLIIQCVVDAEGNRIFDEIDLKQLGAKSSLAMARVFEAAAELNGMTKASVEEIEKN